MKKVNQPLNWHIPVLMACGLPLLSTSSRADVLAYEGFNYPAAGSSLAGKSGGFGWGASWMQVYGGTDDVVGGGSLLASSVTPVGFDDHSTGNSVLLPNGRRDGRALDTTATGIFGTHGYLDANGRIGKDGKTLYISFLQQPNGTTLFYELELHRDDLGDAGRFAGIGNDQPGDNVNLRTSKTVHTLIGAGSTDVNFYVMRIDFKAGNDDVRVYRNPTSGTEPLAADLVFAGQTDMSLTGIAMGAFGNSRTVAHDEIRFGETWADAIGAQPALAISTQPEAAAGYLGGSAKFSVTVAGYPEPTYQWFKGATAIAGATDSTLLLTNLTAADAASYKVTVTNGTQTQTSNSAALTVSAAPGGLLAYEGFDYPVAGASLAGKVGGFGWGDAWTQIDGGTDNVVTGSLSPLLAPGGYTARSTGNSVLLPNGRRDGRLLDTNPGSTFGAKGYLDDAGYIGATGKTLYLSFLQQANGASSFYELEFHRDNLGDQGRIAGIGNDQGGTKVNLRAPDTTHNAIGEGNTDVNLYVVRIDYKDGEDDIRVYRNPTSSTEPGTADLVETAQADMSFNGISFGAFGNGRTVAHDEIRLGETWASVTTGGTTTPATAPAIVTAPSAVTTYAGNTAEFTAAFSGNPAPTYQWFLGNTAIAGATAARLTIPNVQAANAGSYKLTATNSAGSVTTTPVTLTVTPTPAGLLAYEGFEYPVAVNSLGGQNGGFGWKEAWVGSGGSDDVVADSLAPAFFPPGYTARSLGNSVFLPNGRRDARYLDTSATSLFSKQGYLDENGHIGAAGKTLYISFMQKPNGTSLFYEFEFHRDGLTDDTRHSGIGNDQAGGNVNLRTSGSTHTPIGTGSTDVNFYVMRIDFKGGDTGDVRVYRNPVAGSEPPAAELVLENQADMSFNAIALGAYGNGRTVAHDEIRMGETWASVTSGGSVPAAAPAIVSAPSSVSTFTGKTVEFAAVITGSPAPALQWYFNNTAITGATGSRLTLTDVQVADTGSYKLTATNASGSVTTTPVTLTVNAVPDGLLAYEGFDYTAAALSLKTKNGGFGWGSAWSSPDGDSEDVVSGSLTPLTAPSGYAQNSLGNSVLLRKDSRDSRYLDTTAEGLFGTHGYLDANGNIGADGKTLYLSFVQQPNGTTLFYEFELHRGGLDDPTRIAGIGNDVDEAKFPGLGNNVNLRDVRDSAFVHTPIGAGSTDVNFYVMRIDFKDGNDDVRVYRNPTSTTEPGAADLIVTAKADMSFNAIALGAYANNRSVAHDEIRFGETWTSVVPANSTASAAYTEWLTGFTFPAGADTAPTGDPDHDGISNLLEFGFGLNPTVTASAPVAYSGSAVTHGTPALGGTTLANLTGVFGRRKDYVTAGLTYTAQFSADLSKWQDSAAAGTVQASDAQIEVLSLPWPATVPTSAGGNAAPRFFRVKVTSN